MAFRYRCYPTKKQRRFLAKTFGCARHVWNWALEHRTNAYHEEEESLNFAAMCKRPGQLEEDRRTRVVEKPVQRCFATAA